MNSEPRILFVNKTAASGKLSQSDGLERSRIFSHVQRASSNRLSPPEPASPPDRPTSSNSEGTNGRRNSDSRGRKARPRTPKGNVKPKKSVSAPGILQERWRHKGLALDSLSAAMDPFESLAMPMTPCMERLLQIYNTDIAARVFPVTSLAVISRQQTLSMALQDPVLLSTLLCTTSAAVYCESGDPKHGYAAMYFKGHALQRLHKKLSEPHTEAVEISSVFAVSLLLWIECLQGNVQGLTAHVSGLQQLVARADDIRGACLPVMTTIFESSYLCSAILQVQPTMVPNVIHEETVSQQLRQALYTRTELSDEGMAHRFFSAANEDFLGKEILQVISQHRVVMMLKELFSLGEVDPTKEDIQYVFTKQVSVDYQLLTLPFEPEKPLVTPAEHAVRIALFTFGQPIVLVTKASAAFPRSMASQIKDHLIESDLINLWGPSSGLLLWILFIVAHISHGEPEWDWCLSYISRIAEALNIDSFGQLEDVLLGFYHFPHYFGGTLEAIWKEVEQIRRATEELDPLMVVVSHH